ncbi:major facilitator superfamily domain-containing protein [Podospora didyma]|uniref:Major facilitator superfamily domain-containing protein n=1 Tax=Podospora didyma TaxID=330526 RepID=A0AAE0NI59_9PEZI|nr:major facilitator superfamily domain-containing protein [Podospora didyma]
MTGGSSQPERDHQDLSFNEKDRSADLEAQQQSNTTSTYEPKFENSDLEAATIVANDSDRGSSAGKDASPNEDTAQLGPNIIGWDGPNDPHNPMNWTDKKKWTNIAVLSFLTLVTPLGSSMFAPGIPKILVEFHETSTTVATFVLSIYVLGFAVGPLIVAPMSEMYGRSLMYNLGNVFFLIFTICTALSTNIGMLLAFRFLMGLAGSVPITIGSGSIADMMPVEMRGKAMAGWAMGPLLGPCIGPLAGGYLIAAAGWRWVYWLIAILSGITTVVSFLALRETYAPVLLERKAARLSKETGNPDLVSIYHAEFSSPEEKLKQAIIRPMKLLFFAPIVTAMAIYVAVAYAILYLLFTTFSFVYPKTYGFDEGTSGLTFLPAGIGMLIGVVGFGALSDIMVTRRIAAGHSHEPEVRIPLAFTVPAGIALPVGLFIYGWSTNFAVHWIVSMIGVVIFSAGLMGVMMCIQNYLLDAYPRYAASVTAALAVLRSLAGALLPLGGLKMYNALGLGWGNSLLGFVSLAMVPIPVLFLFYGASLRKKFDFKM